MGFLTTITISNDAQHVFEEHPKEFAEAIFEGIGRASCENSEVQIGFRNYGGFITVHKPRHADNHAVYLHKGNMVMAIGQYEKSFAEWANRNPKAALNHIEEAEWILKNAKKWIKTLPVPEKK